MDLLDQIRRIEEIRFTRARRGPPNRDAAGRALLDQCDCAARGPLGQGVMANLDSRNGRHALRPRLRRGHGGQRDGRRQCEQGFSHGLSLHGKVGKMAGACD